ncbi:MAG TPA: phage holin family protein [Rhodospirillaceae bacterium]|nr:phage holin family protein [Rhodospirillaceae bacterium]
MNGPGDTQRSVAELIGELTRESTALFRQEITLAKAELQENARRVATGAMQLVAGALVLMIALAALEAAAIIALAAVTGWWQAAVVVGGAVLLAAALVLILGLAKLRVEGLAPRRTLSSLRNSGRWAREQWR